MKAPKVAGAPSVSDNVAGTVPPGEDVSPIWIVCDLTASRLPAASTENHLNVVVGLHP